MKKNKLFSKLTAIILGIMLIGTSVPFSVFAQSYVDESSQFEYVIVGNNAKLIAYNGWSTDIEIPSTIGTYNVTEIDTGFLDQRQIDRITIPASVINIKKFAFGDSSNSVKEFVVDENNENFSSIDGVLFNKDATVLIQYPGGSVRHDYFVPDGVITINSWAFAGCWNLKYVSLPNSVKTIEDYAFFKDDLNNLSFGTGLKNIGDSAFTNCRNLGPIFIPASVTEIDETAFSGCRQLKIYAPENSWAYTYAQNNSIDVTVQKQIKDFKINLSVDTIYKGTHCYEQSDWINGIEYRYTIYNIPDYSAEITYDDNTTQEFENAGQMQEILGNWPYIISNQSYENQWDEFGGPYDFTVSFLGAEASAQITIVESPITGIQFIPYKTRIMQYTDGYYDTGYINGQPVDFFRYHTAGGKFILNLNDGSTQIYEGEDDLRRDFGVEPDYDDGQTAENPWIEAGIYPVTVSLFGFTVNYSIEIIKNNIESISAAALKPMIFEIDGVYMNEMIDGQNVCYFRYSDIPFDLTLHFNDNTERTYTDMNELYNDYGFFPEVDENQSYTNQWIKGTNKVNISAFGKSCELDVEVIDSPVASIEILSFGKSVYYPSEQPDIGGTKLKINYNDQTSKTVYLESGFYAEGFDEYGRTDIDGYELFYNADWIDDTEVIKLTYMGAEATYPISRADKYIDSVALKSQPQDSTGRNAIITVDFNDGSSEDYKICGAAFWNGENTENHKLSSGSAITDKGIFGDYAVKMFYNGPDLDSMDICFAGYRLQVDSGAFGLINAADKADSYISQWNRFVIGDGNIGFNGTLTADNIDIIIHTLCFDEAQENQPETAEEINAILTSALALTEPVNLSLSQYYNPTSDRYRYNIGNEMYQKPGKLEYKACVNEDGSYTLEYCLLFGDFSVKRLKAEVSGDGKLISLEYVILNGDIDRDGFVDIMDFVKLKKLSATVEYNESADINHDGNVNSFDVLLMRKYLLNEIGSLEF